MASISLRSYQQKIENLVDRGQTEEAVAHCKHILKLFPKHVDTYRLLGKSYLEMQHFQEAGDVLQRVLSVFPDDFISQIGLSIIREDSDNLDQSIWHMERAFEIQPSNNAVQEELKRLYGRRDGVVPQKILLTRGALVRMYVRGEAYPQAIAEGIAALQEDKQRSDIELLLAKSYLRTNQINEAFRLCQKILQSLPYAYEANQLMAEMHILTKQNDQAEPYFERIRMLDPYAAFVNENTPTTAKVDENTIVLDELDKDTVSMDLALHKSTESALSIDDSSDDLDFQAITFFEPQELKTDSQPDSPWFDEKGIESLEEPQSIEQDDEDFLQNLSDAAETSMPETVKKAEIAPISIPEFLQSMTTGVSSETNNAIRSSSSAIPEVVPLSTEKFFSEPQDQSDSEELPDWLKELDKETKQSDIELDLQNEIDSLFTDDGGINVNASENTIEKPASVTDEDDQFTSMFLEDLDHTSQQPGKTRMFSMTANLAAEPAGFDADHDEDPDVANAQQEADIPDWLKDLDQSNRIPASIQSINKIDQEIEEESDEADEDFEQALNEASLSDSSSFTMFSDRDEPEETTSQGTNVLSEEDDAFSWLESLAAKQGAAEDSLLSEQSERPDAPPAWILQDSGQSGTDFPVIDREGNDSISESMFSEALDDEEGSPLTISSLEQEFPHSENQQTSILDEPNKETAWVDEFDNGKDDEIASPMHPDQELPDYPSQVSDIESKSTDSLPPKTPDEIPGWLKELEEQTSIYALSPDSKNHFDNSTGKFENEEEDNDVPEWLSTHSEEKEENKQDELSVEDFTDQKLQEEGEQEETELPDQFASALGNEPLAVDEYQPLFPESIVGDTPLQFMEDIPSQSDEIEVETSSEFDHPLPFDVPDDLLKGLFQEDQPEESSVVSSPRDSGFSNESESSALDRMDQIRELFNNQQYERAFEIVDHMIEEEDQLNEVIEELTKVIYDHPLDPGIYIRLGDAYIRNNEIQKSLDMYQEAENLLQK